MKQGSKDNKNKKIGLKSFIKTNKHSIDGLLNYCLHEVSAIRFLAALIIELGFIIALKPSSIEIIIIAICLTLILSIELVNTAVEAICDLVSPEYNKLVKIAKDSASAATYVISCLTGILTLIIFIPKMF